MPFFKSNIVRFQMMVLVSSMWLIVGCVSALPETSKSEKPVIENPVGDVAPQNEIGLNEVAAANEMPNVISDRQALAEYQLRLSSGNLANRENHEPPVMNVSPNQIPDRQALAEYQLRLSSGTFGYVEDRGPAVIDTLPNQIPDRQALAEYQFRLSGGNLGR